jgi:hypothetical protein
MAVAASSATAHNAVLRVKTSSSRRPARAFRAMVRHPNYFSCSIVFIFDNISIVNVSVDDEVPRSGPTARKQARFSAAAGALFLAFFGLLRPAGAAELVMFAAPGCGWCAAWEAEVGVVYDRTEEGRRAPLRRVDKTADRPADLATVQNVAFTPTFILMEEGVEIGRIVGYPGENFFWPMLQDLLARLKPRSGGNASS